MLPLRRFLLRYASVSACCAVINNVLLIGLDMSGLHTIRCLLISAAVMIPLAYALHVHWTFATAARPASFGRYILISMLNLPGSWALIILLHNFARVPMAIAAPLATGALFVANFHAARWSIVDRADRTLPDF